MSFACFRGVTLRWRREIPLHTYPSPLLNSSPRLPFSFPFLPLSLPLPSPPLFLRLEVWGMLNSLGESGRSLAAKSILCILVAFGEASAASEAALWHFIIL